MYNLFNDGEVNPVGKSNFRCIISKRYFRSIDIVSTVVGDIWIGFWGKEPLVFNEKDLVLLPRSFKPWLDILGIETKEEHFVPERITFYVR